MGKRSFKELVLDGIALVAWKIFLWASGVTESEYHHNYYQDIKNREYP